MAAEGWETLLKGKLKRWDVPGDCPRSFLPANVSLSASSSRPGLLTPVASKELLGRSLKLVTTRTLTGTHPSVLDSVEPLVYSLRHGQIPDRCPGPVTNIDGVKFEFISLTVVRHHQDQDTGVSALRVVMMTTGFRSLQLNVKNAPATKL